VARLERGFEFERLLLFSDAVFAIAITLSAVSLPVPDLRGNVNDGSLLQAIFGNEDIVFAYLIGFAVIGLFWLGHHRVFATIVKWDTGLMVWNLVFLFLVAILPWPTRIMARYGQVPDATALYALFVAATGLALAGVWNHAWTHDLMVPGLDPRLHHYSVLRGLMIPGVFLFSIPLAFINPDYAQLAWIAVIPLEWGLSRWAHTHGIVRSISENHVDLILNQAKARLKTESSPPQG